MQRHVLGASKSIKDGARGGEEKKNNRVPSS